MNTRKVDRAVISFIRAAGGTDIETGVDGQQHSYARFTIDGGRAEVRWARSRSNGEHDVVNFTRQQLQRERRRIAASTATFDLSTAEARMFAHVSTGSSIDRSLTTGRLMGQPVGAVRFSGRRK